MILNLSFTVVSMSSVGNFTDFIQAGDAKGLQVFMTNERSPRHSQRNNRALFEACRDGDDEICEVLISFGADVNSEVNHRTPLYIACQFAYPACVDLLLAHGVNVNVGCCGFGRTPLMATASEDNTPSGLTLDEFIENRCRCMRSLLAAGVAIDQTDNVGWNALMYATWNFRLTQILIEAGANLDILNTDNNMSALHYACMEDDIDVTALLLEGGASIDAVDRTAQTSLHLACLYLKPAIVDSLLRHNADIDIVNNSGRTALQCAMSRPSSSPNRVAVLQLMATCAHTRLEASSADWIRLARNERLSQ